MKYILERVILKYATTKKTIYNHPQPSTTTQKLLKPWLVTNSDVTHHFRCSYWKRRWVLILIWNNGIYIYMCACLCLYTLQVITLTSFGLGWLLVFASIKSNSFYVKSDDFYLLKIWILELMLINIKQRSVKQSIICSWTTLRVYNTEHFQRKFLLSWSRYCCCWYQCRNFKREWNSVAIICSKYCRSSFFRECNRLSEITY